MKTQVENFGTNRQWKALGSDISKLKGKLEVLDVKIDEVNRKARELADFTDNLKLMTLVILALAMFTLLINNIG